MCIQDVTTRESSQRVMWHSCCCCSKLGNRYCMIAESWCKLSAVGTANTGANANIITQLWFTATMIPRVKSKLASICCMQLTSSSPLHFPLPHHSLCCTVWFRDHVLQCLWRHCVPPWAIIFLLWFLAGTGRVNNKNLNSFFFFANCHSLSVNKISENTEKHFVHT